MAKSKNGNSATIEDVHTELRMANRLMIAQLALFGVQQKDIAALIDRTDSVVSEMFPKGLLRRLGGAGKPLPARTQN
jgi:hypothetical protein